MKLIGRRATGQSASGRRIYWLGCFRLGVLDGAAGRRQGTLAHLCRRSFQIVADTQGPAGTRPRQAQITVLSPYLQSEALYSSWFVGDNWRGMTEYPASIRNFVGWVLPAVSKQSRSVPFSSS